MRCSGKYTQLVDRKNWVAIIGSREATQEELNAAYQLGYVSAKKGKVVVSGLARGIDTAAHLGALDGGGITIAIVHTKENQPIYPPENALLAERIKEAGCILYPFDGAGKIKLSNVQRLIERSVLNAFLCPTIIVVKTSESIISGGTKWATHYGLEKFKSTVYRLDNVFEFHKYPEVEACRMWWIPILNNQEILKQLKDFTLNNKTELEGLNE